MDFPVELLINAIIAGVLLGGFYVAVTVGISISFGMLDIVNIAHPAFIILGSYLAYIINQSFGLDPVLVGLLMLPVFYALGAVGLSGLLPVVREARAGSAARPRVLLRHPVHHRGRADPRVRRRLPLRRRRLYRPDAALRLRRPALPHAGALRALARRCWSALQLYLSRTFIGRAIMAVAQDQQALSLMAANPIKIKRIAFGISIATAAMAGAFLIIIQPVEPSVGREYIGRVFAICVLGGLGSLPGTVIGAMLLGIVESITATFYGPSWAPAVAFGFLLLTLAFRPAGLLGR